MKFVERTKETNMAKPKPPPPLPTGWEEEAAVAFYVFERGQCMAKCHHRLRRHTVSKVLRQLINDKSRSHQGANSLTRHSVSCELLLVGRHTPPVFSLCCFQVCAGLCANLDRQTINWVGPKILPKAVEHKWVVVGLVEIYHRRVVCFQRRVSGRIWWSIDFGAQPPPVAPSCC